MENNVRLLAAFRRKTKALFMNNEEQKIDVEVRGIFSLFYPINDTEMLCLKR